MNCFICAALNEQHCIQILKDHVHQSDHAVTMCAHFTLTILQKNATFTMAVHLLACYCMISLGSAFFGAHSDHVVFVHPQIHVFSCSKLKR